MITRSCCAPAVSKSGLMRVLLPPAPARRPMSASLQGEDGVDAYGVFFTSGHLDSDSGWNAWSAGIVATSL
jgi:hypothetical protein